MLLLIQWVLFLRRILLSLNTHGQRKEDRIGGFPGDAIQRIFNGSTCPDSCLHSLPWYLTIIIKEILQHLIEVGLIASWEQVLSRIWLGGRGEVSQSAYRGKDWGWKENTKDIFGLPGNVTQGKPWLWWLVILMWILSGIHNWHRETKVALSHPRQKAHT